MCRTAGNRRPRSAIVPAVLYFKTHSKCFWGVSPSRVYYTRGARPWEPVAAGFSAVAVWIGPCAANDSEMAHRWAALLVKSGAVTGDELRKLSPFDLEEKSEFSGPVSTGHDRELAEATRELAEATSELKMPSI